MIRENYIEFKFIVHGDMKLKQLHFCLHGAPVQQLAAKARLPHRSSWPIRADVASPDPSSEVSWPWLSCPSLSYIDTQFPHTDYTNFWTLKQLYYEFVFRVIHVRCFYNSTLEKAYKKWFVSWSYKIVESFLENFFTANSDTLNVE